MRKIAQIAAVFLSLVAHDSGAGVVLFQRLTDTIQLSSPANLGTTATLEARILYTSNYNGGWDLYREWVNAVEDKHLAVSPTAINVELHDVATIQPTPTTIGLNTWHHIAAVYDGTSVNLYLDGVRIATTPASGSIANGSALPIFGGGIFESYYPNANGFIGYVDWFRMSNVARYSGASFTPPSSQPANDSNTVLLFYFDDAPGSATAADASNYHNNGTLGVGPSGATAPVFMADPLTPPSPPQTATIPTLSESMLICLVAAVAVTGGILVRRRLMKIAT